LTEARGGAAWLFGSAAALLVTSCGGVKSAADYSGSEERPLVEAWQVREEPVLPPGYDAIGEVTASCKLVEPRGRLRHTRLSDLDCSEARLLRTLREEAAAVGGELLVGRECRSRVDRDGRRGRELAERCTATVGRPADDALEARRIDAKPAKASDPGLSPEQVELVEEPVASDAWRISVDYTPAKDSTGPRPARRADLVRELASLPVSHVRLGDLVTRCQRGCAPESVRVGVRIAAGRVGATDVVDVRCIEKGLGVLCTGTAAAYELDPDMYPEAR
jgi:hypothetical protein